MSPIRSFRPRRPSRAIVITGTVVLAIAMGGTAYAAIPNSSTGVISGCYQTILGNLRIIDTQAGQRCSLLEKQLDWNQTGPRGPKGDTGPAGPQGPPGPASDSTGGTTLGTKSMTKITEQPTLVTIVKVDLPVGTYLLTANGRVDRLDHNSGSDLLVRCRLIGGGAVLDEDLFRGPTTTPISSAPVTLTGRVDLTAAGTVLVECTHLDFLETNVEGVGFQLLAQGVAVQDNG